eukprot:s361_g32.t1
MGLSFPSNLAEPRSQQRDQRPPASVAFCQPQLHSRLTPFGRGALGLFMTWIIWIFQIHMDLSIRSSILWRCYPPSVDIEENLIVFGRASGKTFATSKSAGAFEHSRVGKLYPTRISAMMCYVVKFIAASAQQILLR